MASAFSITAPCARRFYPVLSFSLLFALWQLGAWLKNGVGLPYPSQVWDQALLLIQNPLGGRTIIQHIGFSMQRVLLGYLIAIALGIPLGLARGWIPLVDKVVKPIFEVLRPIPPIAWIPLAILWLGLGEGPKIFICFIAAFIIAVLTSYTGMRYVDSLLIDMARSFGATRRQQFFAVALPACLPAIFSGLHSGLSFAWMGVLAAELVGAREGVGYIIVMGMDLAKPELTIVGMIIIGAIGGILAAALRILEGRLCPWRRHQV